MNISHSCVLNGLETKQFVIVFCHTVPRDSFWPHCNNKKQFCATSYFLFFEFQKFFEFCYSVQQRILDLFYQHFGKFYVLAYGLAINDVTNNFLLPSPSCIHWKILFLFYAFFIQWRIFCLANIFSAV